MIAYLIEQYHKLPMGLQQSPIILALLLVIFLFMTGHLYTGKTFDREITRCNQDIQFYRDLYLNKK